MRWEDTEIEKAVVRREAMMRRMVVGIIRMLRRDIIHSYKSEKPHQSVSLWSADVSKELLCQKVCQDMACMANINTAAET